MADNTNTFYLTRAPGRTGDVSGFWEATLTPNGRGSGAELVGYRGAGLTITDFTWEDAGAGTLAPGTMSLGGVTYTVDALAVVSNAVDSGWNVSLRTDPLLPRGQDLWLELGHVDGTSAVFAIDTASVEAPGYRWRDAYAGEDRHGWGTDGSDADTDIDSVTVRLSTGRADHHGHGAGGRDADGGHHRHHGCGRADRRHLQLPVDPGERHGYRHCEPRIRAPTPWSTPTSARPSRSR